MPYLIPDADFDLKLSLLDKNVEHTKSFIEKGVIDFHLPEATIPNGYRFVKALNKDEYRMVTTESGQPETVYAVKLLFRNDLVLNKETCTQIMVWRTLSFKHQIAASSLPRVFFKHLLNSYSIVVTDEEQTGDGKRFWKIMINWALETNYHVYVSDGTEIDRPLTQISSMDELIGKWEAFCWGHDAEVHRHRLIVISKNDLL
ncbi:hypothetical protein ABLB69_15515 [Xenorhabdus khoisanae]|uniref:hypothetical protein n=1 Tax=Xenorhabdus khoisanae TaxID=880157 RepID=UPI002359C897|nr:hypothetical protein [Xenorhabdus khoisanae]MDC9615365.1 hypothetical protein [Xenorhabdus khoisanae]